MANILITRLCNRHCIHCFARGGSLVVHPGTSGAAGPGLHMAPDELDRVVEFARKSGLEVVGVMGGEPALHPECLAVVERLLAAGLRVRFFTGGLIPDHVLDGLKGLDKERVHVGVNLPAPDEPLAAEERDRIDRSLRELGEMAMVAFTVYDAAHDLRFLVDSILHFGLRRSIRLGLCLPVADRSRPAALPVSEYPAVVPRIMELSEACAEHGIVLSFDCGFTRCMFSAEELALFEQRGVHTVFACSPIVDIGPDLVTWSCFPLARLASARLEDFADREELVKHFRQTQKAYRNLGVHDQCLECDDKRNGRCAGGCLAHVIRGME